MGHPEAKKSIARHKCAACGTGVDVKLNKNGIAYYYCTGVTEGGLCSHHQKWGRAHSDQMQANYLAARKSAKQAQETETDGSTATDISDDQDGRAERRGSDPFAIFD